MSEINFSYFRCLICQNYPEIKSHKFVRIWNPFPTWIEILENEKTCTYSIQTMRPICNCSRISRASRASLIPINRLLTFEEKYTQALRKNQRLHHIKHHVIIVVLCIL
jgi:hypothetical protein